jgi:DNA-binding MarR family transcriptional regulator
VPGKQLYLPDYLMDLREGNQTVGRKKKTEKLLPSAQFIILYHMLQSNKTQHLEDDSFTQLALRFGYTKMAITKAVDNLVYHELCKVEGTKEKYIRFLSIRKELWNRALPLFTTPVLKLVYVDEKPEGMHLLQANEYALPEYSDMNPSRQKYYAIEKGKFYDLQKTGKLINPNEFEGKYGLEVWKYNPEPLVELVNPDTNVVDPLSLYLCLKDNPDERIEMALEQILDHYLW